jgi:TolA-binding protein
VAVVRHAPEPPVAATTRSTSTPKLAAATPAVTAPTVAVASDPIATAPAVVEPPAISPGDLKAAPSVRAPSTAAPRAAATTSVAPVAAAPAGGSLPAEIAALDRARKALEGGDPAQALGLVDAYEAQYPNGTFSEEAEVLRVEALAKRGDRARATAAGQRFLAAHPTSPHAARIRAILAPSNP